jgi:hypothetical protein
LVDLAIGFAMIREDWLETHIIDSRVSSRFQSGLDRPELLGAAHADFNLQGVLCPVMVTARGQAAPRTFS